MTLVKAMPRPRQSLWKVPGGYKFHPLGSIRGKAPCSLAIAFLGAYLFKQLRTAVIFSALRGWLEHMVMVAYDFAVI